MATGLPNVASKGLVTGLTLLVSSCVVQRTVRDENGNVIYQEPEWNKLTESEEEKFKEVREKEEELGW